MKFSIIFLISLLFVTLSACTARADVNVEALVTLKTDIMVPSRVSGVLKKVAVREGDIVEPGQLLAEFDATIATGEYQAALHEARIYQLQRDNDVDIRLSQKTRDVSQRELRRSLKANDRYAKAVSATELERLQMMVDQADLSEDKARLDLEVAAASFDLKRTLANTNNSKLQMHRIVSPIRGMVVVRNARVGEWLDVGQAFARVIQVDVLRVEANVDGTKNGEELLRREVKFATEYGGEIRGYSGRIVYVSPELDPVDGMVRVWAEVENTKRTLKPGMRGTLTIPTTSP